MALILDIYKLGLRRYFVAGILILLTRASVSGQCLAQSDSLYRSAEALYTEGAMPAAGIQFLQAAEAEWSCAGGSYENIAGALSNAAVCFEAASEYSNASTAYRKLLYHARREQDTKTTASVYLSLSRIEMSQARFAPAAAYADSALLMHTMQGNTAGQIEALVLVSDQLIFHGKYDEALAKMNPYLSSPQLTREDTFPQLTQKLGLIYEKANIPDSAAKYYLSALRIYQTRNNAQLIAENAASLAGCYLQLGNKQDALAYYRLSSDTYKSINNPISQGVGLRLCAEIVSETGNAESALKDLRTAYHLFSQESYQEGVSGVLLSVGNVFNKAHNIDSALFYYGNARNMAQSTSDTYLETKITGLIASMYLSAGRPHDAVSEYTSIIDGAQPGSSQRLALQYGLGAIYRQLGQDHNAEQILRNALAEAASVSDFFYAGHIFYMLGQIEQDSKRYDSAIKSFRNALDAYSRVRSVAHVVAARHQLGTAYALAGHFRQAISEYRASQSLSVHSYDRRMAGLNSMGIAQLYAHADMSDSAQAHYQESINMFKLSGYRLEQAKAHNALACHFLRNGKAAMAISELKANLRFCQQMRSDRYSGDDHIDSVIADCYGYLSDAYFAQNNISDAFYYKDMAWRTGMSSIINKYTQGDTALGLAALQGGMGSHELYLSYVQTCSYGSYCMAASQSIAKIIPLDNARWAQDIMQDSLLAALSLQGAAHLGLPSHRTRHINAGGRLSDKDAADLTKGLIAGYTLVLRTAGTAPALLHHAGGSIAHYLLAPVLPDLKDKSAVTIFASGLVQSLPFESLPLNDTHYVASRYALSYSASAWSSLYEPVTAPAPCTRALTALRAHEHSSSATCIAALSANEKRQLRAALAHTHDSAQLSYLYDNIQCPESAQTAAAASPASLSIGSTPMTEISESSLKKLSSQGALLPYCWVHFHASAFTIGEAPQLSALALASGNGQDGYLTTNEIMQLRLNADAVSISGYSAPVVDNNGFALGLPFKIAGARSLVASQWPTTGDFASKFLNAFYAQLQAGGSSPVEALFKTKNEFISGKYGFAWSKPYFWDSFILQK